MSSGSSLDAERRLAEVTRAAAHDLGEPLRAVAGFADLLSEHVGDELDERGHQYLAHIVGGVERMQVMVDALLAWLRLGRVELDITPVDLGEVVSAEAQELVTSRPGREAELSISDLPTVAGDAALLHELFHHLLSNALTFRRPTGPHRVRVDAEARDGGWAITVADSGIGIDPRHRERVFGLFQRLHTREEHPGTGIGLPICRTVAERHGGTILLGDGDGGGTTVTVVLPDVSVTGRAAVPSGP